MQQFTKQELELAMQNYAPTVNLLIAAGLKYDLTERADKPTVLEHETMSDPREAYMDDAHEMAEGLRDEPTFQLESIHLPNTHCHYNEEGGAAFALQRVLQRIEEEALRKLREVAYKTDCLQNAQQYLWDKKRYGPYLVTGEMMIQLTPDVVRVYLMSHPKKVEHETGTRVEASMTIVTCMDYAKTYGIAKW